MVKDKVASKIAEEWFNSRGDFNFTMSELNGVGFDVKSEDDAKSLSLEIKVEVCLLYTSPSPRDRTRSRMPSSA